MSKVSSAGATAFAGIHISTSPPSTLGMQTDSSASTSARMTITSPSQVLAAAGDKMEYKGVRLLPNVEQIEFDEGVYVGTVDENGAMTGFGKATWRSGDAYEGEWLNDYMHGKGTYTWADGDYYHGDYVEGSMNGFGEMKGETGFYTGEWVDDMRQGYGRMQYSNGNVYEGQWLAGMRHGQGKLMEPQTGVTYEGEFVRNEKEGKGIQTNADGDTFEGEFASGMPNGRGTYVWADGAKYIGMFKDGVKHGEGCEWLANGDWIAGVFVNGEHDDAQSTLHKATDGQDTATEAVEELPDDVVEALMAPLNAEKLRLLTDKDGAAAEAERADGGSQGTGAAMAREKQGGDKSSGDEADECAFEKALAASATLLDDKDLEDWKPLKTIGKGSFGAVYTALLRNGRTVCVKVVELGNLENEDEMEKLKNEIALMKRLHHPNCVQYYGSLEDKMKNTVNIFMEYVSGGTLTSFVTKFKAIPLSTLRQWSYQMVCGVKYLHDCGIVHRDIKGDNVLVSLDGIVKLADFGCSKAIDDVCSATHGCSTMVGTPYWMAPEVIKCEAGGYGMKSDIWSIGCTMVEMVTGKPPWPECNSMWAAVYKIANSTGLPTEIPKDLDEELMNLLELCFERDPKKRPTAAELLKHPFLAKVEQEAKGGR